MSTNIKRPVIRYNNIALLKSKSPSFSLDSNSGNGVSFLSHINNLSFNFSIPENNQGTISSKSVLRHSFKPNPKVDIGLSKNESFNDLFLECFILTGAPTGKFINDLNRDFNIYGIISDEIQNDAIPNNFTGFDMVSFGNCKLESFSMSQQVNGVIESDYSFTAYNMKAERVIGENLAFSGEAPCLNLTGDQTNRLFGVPIGYSFTGLNEKYERSATGSSLFPHYNTKIFISGLNDTETFLVETDSIQSFDFRFDVKSKDIFSIGKKHPISRKALFPADGTFSFSNKISTFKVHQAEAYEDFSAEKNLKDYLNKALTYSIKIDMANTTGKSVVFEIPKARLESQSHSISIGSDFDCDLAFSFNLDEARIFV